MKSAHEDDIDPTSQLLAKRCLGPIGRRRFTRTSTLILVGGVAIHFLIYFVFLVLPDHTVARLFESFSAVQLRGWMQLDHPYFLESSNSIAAPRIWLTEASMTVATILLSTAMVIETVVVANLELESRLAFQKENLLSLEYASGIFVILLILFLRHVGFSEGIILGQYKVSTGPTDGAVAFFALCSLSALIGTTSLGFFASAVLAKIRCFNDSKL